MAYFKKHWDPDLFSEVEEVVQMRVSLSIYFFFSFACVLGYRTLCSTTQYNYLMFPSVFSSDFLLSPFQLDPPLSLLREDLSIYFHQLLDVDSLSSSDSDTTSSMGTL